jgi:hypothetical protein
MSFPCEQKETIHAIDSKLDTLIELQIDNATIHAELLTQNAKVADHENRIRKIEKAPIRLLYWIGAIFATLISGFFTHKIWG